MIVDLPDPVVFGCEKRETQYFEPEYIIHVRIGKKTFEIIYRDKTLYTESIWDGYDEDYEVLRNNKYAEIIDQVLRKVLKPQIKEWIYRTNIWQPAERHDRKA